MAEMNSNDGPGAALALYEDLIEGHWDLEKPRYLFYADSARRWAERAPELSSTLQELRAREHQKAALTEKSFQALDEPRRDLSGENGIFLAFWRDRDNSRVVLILSPEYCRKELWPPILGNSSTAPVAVSIAAPGGRLFAGEPLTGSTGLSSTQTAADGGLSWQISTRPRDMRALDRGISWRQQLYLGMISLVIVMLGFGGYFLVRAVRREMEVARLKSGFVSTVSHEFRSPLTGIRQLANMLEQGRVPSDEKRQQYYTLMRRESDRLARLVENLLDFSRMEEGRREYRQDPIDVSAWLGGLAEEFRGDLSGQEARLETTIPENLPAICGDREALSTAVLNLLDNAVKYSLPPVTVRLEVEAVGTDISIRVCDKGIGISDEDQAHIFDKFFRGGSEATQTVRGAGLGLSLVQHIVTAHKGTLHVDSRPGEGSTFTIRLRSAT
jgi:signal transduction histidine kinase